MIQNYWKYIIITLITCLVSFHITAIFHIIGNKYELTSPDYYAEEAHIDANQNALRSGADWEWYIDINDNRDQIRLRVERDGEGIALDDVKVQLYRPNAAGQDQHIALTEQNDGSLLGQLGILAIGRWDITVAAKHAGSSVRYQERLRVQ